jgi:hypothetical protein
VSLSSVIASLATALDAISIDIRTYTDPGANLDPPCVVIGLPDILFQTYGGNMSPTPIEASLTLYLMVQADAYATENLSALLEQVVDAIWSVADYSVTDAKPGVWKTSNVDLPAYVLTVVGPAN